MPSSTYNPAAQRMTGLPEQPGGTLLERFPHAVAAGIFAYYQRAFETGEVLTYETNYQADGLEQAKLKIRGTPAVTSTSLTAKTCSCYK